MLTLLSRFTIFIWTHYVISFIAKYRFLVIHHNWIDVHSSNLSITDSFLSRHYFCYMLTVFTKFNLPSCLSQMIFFCNANLRNMCHTTVLSTTRILVYNILAFVFSLFVAFFIMKFSNKMFQKYPLFLDFISSLISR